MLNYFFYFITEKALAATAPSLGPRNPPGSTAGSTPNFSPNPNGIGQIVENSSDKALAIITIIAGALATIYLIWNGIQYITSAGNPEKIKSARSGMINAVIGIVIIVAAYAIIRFAISIGNTVNTVT